MEKRWLCLFTCMTTSSVHLKLAGDLTTDSFIMALRRFCGRRGNRKTMRLDNGTNFVGCLEVTEWRTDYWRAFSRRDHLVLQARFIPNTGGIFESTVKQVNRAMKTVINDQLPPEKTLHTVLVEAEVIINSRPLTGVCDDINDNETLTPNHFLIGRASLNTRSVWRTWN